MMWNQQAMFNEYYLSQYSQPYILPHAPYPPPIADTTIIDAEPPLPVTPKSSGPILPPTTELTPPDSEPGDDKQFRCSYHKCAYVTNRRNNLKRHVATMHERLNKPHQCCGLPFIRKADLRIHNKECHEKGYDCTWLGCSKHFMRKALLDRHMATHTGERTYFCSVCNYGTSNKSNRDRHFKIHYKNNGHLPPPPPGQKYMSNMYEVFGGSGVPMAGPATSGGGGAFDGWYTTPKAGAAQVNLNDVWHAPRDSLESNEMDLMELNQSPAVLSPPRMLVYSPEKSTSSLPIAPFPSCDLNSISSILLSPLKTERDELEMWFKMEAAELKEESVDLTQSLLAGGRDHNKHTINNILGHHNL